MAAEAEKTAINSTGRKKVKTGCKTCKIRKVKCDEARPACNRCTSTGRACEGYGIWGGGSQALGHQRQHSNDASVSITWKKSQLNPLPSECVAIVEASRDATLYLDWYKCTTSKKLPGIFLSSFWDAMLIQASMSEPAVLNAILALGAVHKQDICNGEERPGDQEKFMLRHYNQAIRDLQPAFSSRLRNSERLTLIGCIIFVSLEMLRGRFRTAQILLQNGLQVLREKQDSEQHGSDNSVFTFQKHDVLDDLTTSTLYRLQFQASLIQHIHQGSDIIPYTRGPEPSSSMFYSHLTAWQDLEYSLSQIFELSYQIRHGKLPGTLMPDILFARQQQIQTRLAHWKKTCQASIEYLGIRQIAIHKRATKDLLYHWLLAYHTMATIMTATCLHPYDESVYDAHEELFASLLEHATHIWEALITDPTVRALPGPWLNMANSIIDLGWIPLLYYTATKCRVHSIRQEAVRFMKFSSHREGVFDANMLACVAGKLMEIERSSETQADMYPSPDSIAQSGRMSSSALNDFRAYDLKVELPDGPMDVLKMSYTQRQSDGKWNIKTTQFNQQSRRWSDEQCTPGSRS